VTIVKLSMTRIMTSLPTLEYSIEVVGENNS